MTLLSVERIKLFSTRSPYWCLGAVLAAALLFALLMGLVTVDGHQYATPATSQAGLQLGMMVFMVLATLAITTEYRFGTIRATFLAAPQRTRVLAAKTIVLMILGAITAAVCSFAAFFLAKALASSPRAAMVLETGAEWRSVLGNAALFPIAAIIGIAVGTLIRQSAGAITLLLVWSMLIEGLVNIIPNVGPKIAPWMPFNAGSTFTVSNDDFSAMGGPSAAPGVTVPTPVEGLLVFAATAVVLWIIAAWVVNRRDA